MKNKNIIIQIFLSLIISLVVICYKLPPIIDFFLLLVQETILVTVIINYTKIKNEIKEIMSMLEKQNVDKIRFSDEEKLKQHYFKEDKDE